MPEHFCTYFDHRYAPKGLAMWRSLKRHCPSAVLHVLCLNEVCESLLAGLDLPDVHRHTLKDLENADPALLVARGNRTLVEYFFTLTPCFPLYLLRTQTMVTRLTYVDADLFFFADPSAVFDEVAGAAAGLIEHRFPEALAGHEKYGRFNVGWLTFGRDPVGLDCLESWRQQCLDWCHDRVESGRFAEQKYLDEWPERFPRIHVIAHRGANVAPWNLDVLPLSTRGQELTIGGQPLLFFHAHGFLPGGPGHARVTNLEPYGVRETALMRQAIFEPYERALLSATSEMAVPLTLALLAEPRRHAASLQEGLDASEADRQAAFIRVRELEARLSAVDAERASLADKVHGLNREVDIHRAQAAAQLGLLDALTKQVEELEGHRTQLASAVDRLSALERSRSWRWTRPFRWVSRPLFTRR